MRGRRGCGYGGMGVCVAHDGRFPEKVIGQTGFARGR
jgi:hypothetical protein